MAHSDILLVLVTYPEPTPVSVVDDAIDFAAAIGAKISAVACEAQDLVPSSSLFAGVLLENPVAAEAETKISSENAEKLMAAFQDAAGRRGVFRERILTHCLALDIPRVLVEYARLHDLAIVSVPQDGILEQWYADSIVFGSGRPTVIIPHARKRTAAFVPETVVVAWDFSRPAARAVADALPILEKAKGVYVVTVSNEKVFDTKGSGPELTKHLARHGIEVVLENVDAAGRWVGDVLESYVESHNADLLVMGAYGHSRLRDFILGGATTHMVSRPPLPVFLSH
jgi:nucleotide-binding universal stress UspA family protein